MRQRALGLLSERSDWLGQGVRYAITGGAVSAVYLLTTLSLANFGGLPFQVALLIGFIVAVTTHFVAQRLFVWRHDEAFALPLRQQAVRYLPISLAQYGLTAVSTSVLPHVLGLPTDLVYLATAPCLTLLTFVMMRTHVFHPEERVT